MQRSAAIALTATIIEKAPRPLLRWVCLFSSAWAMGLGDALQMGLDNTARGIVLTFVCTVYGLRGLERIKGAA